MINMLKAELETVKRQKKQILAELNALIGAEKVLEKVIAQAEKTAENAKTNVEQE